MPNGFTSFQNEFASHLFDPVPILWRGGTQRSWLSAMSSKISSNTPSQTQMSSILSSRLLSSRILSSSIFSSVPLSMEPLASSHAFPSSESLQPLPSPSPSSSPDFLPSSSSPPDSLSFSSPLSSESSYPTSLSSVISSKEIFDVASSTTTESSSRSLGAESTSAVTNDRGSLRPVEIVAIGLGVVTAVLGIAAILLVFCFRRKRHRHHPLYGLPYAKQNKVSNTSSHSDVEARETPSGRSYFRSLSEQKGTTPLLQNPLPNNSDLSHDAPYVDIDLPDHALFPVQTLRSPPQSLSQHEILALPSMPMQNMTPIRPPRSPPPPQPEENSRQLLSLTIPESLPQTSTIRSSKPSTQGSDALPRAEVLAYADENGDIDDDSPSIYSQTSANVLSRGPSVSSHVSVRRFSMPPTVLESIVSGGSPIEEKVRRGVINAGSDNHPIGEGPDFLNMDPFPESLRSHLNRNSRLERQNTTAVASLLKTRLQRQSESLPTVPSGVSHIERAGSIKPARGVEADAERVVERMSGENSGMDGREPYGRRFRRTKTEQGI